MLSSGSSSLDAKKASTEHIENVGNNDNNNNNSPNLLHDFKSCIITGDGGEFVVLGNQKYLRHELMQAVGGVFNPARATYPVHQVGNAAPLGLIGTFITIFAFGLFLARVKGIETTNVAVGMCMFMGGCVMFLAGLWCFCDGSPIGTFNLTVLTSYATFWLSFGAIYIPSFGIEAAYEDYPDQFNSSIGFLGVAWSIFTTMLLICALKTTIPLFIGLLMLDMATILLAAGYFLDSAGIKRACGVFAVLHGFAVFYQALDAMATPHNSYYIFKTYPMPDATKIFKWK